MIVLKSDKSAFFDCDDTLVLWSPTPEEKEKYGIDIYCPGSTVLDKDGNVNIGPGWIERLVPHFAHIEQIKKHKARLHFITVWSAGGWEWAEAVVKALKLENYVDLVIAKPAWAYDDVSPETYMPKSQYMKNEFPKDKE